MLNKMFPSVLNLKNIKFLSIASNIFTKFGFKHIKENFDAK